MSYSNLYDLLKEKGYNKRQLPLSRKKQMVWDYKEEFDKEIENRLLDI